MSLAPGTRLGTFKILAPLGAGGMGEVYRARDTRLGRDVALKVLPAEFATHPDRLARFEREARIVAGLNHPNVVVLHSVDHVNGIHFLTMELVDGQGLDRLISPGGLPLSRVLDLVIPTADALAATHAKGVVHRDLKPANVMVTREGHVKVLDFGIAKLEPTLSDASPGQAMTIEAPLSVTGQIVGTADYMAPEQIRGEAVDARTDLFAFGVLLYELVSGRRPFRGGTFVDVASSILRDTPEPLSRARADLPARFEQLVERCLEKDPDRRFQSAREVRDGLRALRRAIDAEAHAGTTPAPVQTPPRRRMRPAARWALIAIAGLAVSAGAFLLLRAGNSRVATDDRGKRLSVAVLEFENLTGDTGLDWMKRGAPELLSAALIQSAALDVFDAQRLEDLISNEGAGSSARRPTYAFLSRSGIRRAITGSILRAGSALRIESRIVDTDDGRVLWSIPADGAADSTLFYFAGRIIPDLQVALEVDVTGDREAEVWLREITTTSADAYRFYLRGHEALLAGRWREAASAYEQALAIDSTFVAARTEVSGAYWNLGDAARLAESIAAMHRMRPRANPREQLRIDLLESVVRNDPPGLIRAASALVELYPENRFYLYLLGRGYFTAQQYRRCLETLQPLVDQRYEWPWTYVLSAQSAVELGDNQYARSAFELGFAVSGGEPDLAYAYVRFLREQGDHGKARTVIEEALQYPALGESPAGEGALRLEFARDLAARGDTVRALEELRRATALIPGEDLARAEADSLLRSYGVR